jgi:hypothetical protein
MQVTTMNNKNSLCEIAVQILLHEHTSDSTVWFILQWNLV